MTAFFLISNQQHWGKVGDLLYVDKFEGEVGAKVSFDQVLTVDQVFGTPFIKNAKVECEIMKHGKDKKIRVLKFKSQKRHRKVTGFRREYTQLQILKIIS